jgi:integrase/recombinase XerD
MRTYYNYLKHKGFAVSTIIQHERNISSFFSWLSENSLELKHCGYSEMIQFIAKSMDSHQILSKKRCHINRTLTSITYYFDYIAEKNPFIINPAKNIRIRNSKKRLVHDMLDFKELSDLYRQINPNTPRNSRNQVILGFLICQGLTVRELHNLRLDDLKLREGLVLIRGDNPETLRKGTTSREIPLDAVQVIDLLEYLKNIRPKILSGKYLMTPGRKPQRGQRLRKSNQVILSINGSYNLKNTLHHLFLDLKKYNSRVKSAIQLRQSLITHWLTKFNLRNVQYMAGHRYVSSTEWYKGSNLEDLKREINLFHPLK